MNVGEVLFTNGMAQSDAFSPLLFVLVIDPLIKILKRRGVNTEILYYMDDLKASTSTIGGAQTIHKIVKIYAASVGMVFIKRRVPHNRTMRGQSHCLSRTSPNFLK